MNGLGSDQMAPWSGGIPSHGYPRLRQQRPDKRSNFQFSSGEMGERDRSGDKSQSDNRDEERRTSGDESKLRSTNNEQRSGDSGSGSIDRFSETGDGHFSYTEPETSGPTSTRRIEELREAAREVLRQARRVADLADSLADALGGGSGAPLQMTPDQHDRRESP